MMTDAEMEASFYYAGLPSNPISVYQTGAPWKKPADPYYPVRKEARPIFDHPIADAWDELGPQVCDYLDTANVKWTSIDVVRFADVRTYPGPLVPPTVGPPVLWIGVMPASLSREDAEVAAVGCDGLLEKFALTDGAVEIAFRESVFTQSGGGPRLFKYDYDLWDDTADVRGPLTPALGLQIAARDTPEVEGTGGLYIREGTRVFVLTARHVVLPPDAVPNELYDHTQPCRDVLLLGTKAFQGVLKPIEDKIEEQSYELERYIRNSEPEEQATSEDLYWTYQNILYNLNKFHDDLTENWSEESQRVLGHIAYAPPISVGTSTRHFMEDWALIELDNEKIDWETFRGNVIDLGTSFTLIQQLFAGPKYLLNRLLPLRGIVTDDELRHPTKLDANGKRYLSVTKRGNSTGATIGRAGGIMSFVKEYFPGGKHETSVQLAIYPYLDPFYHEGGAFSAPGDSGAIIADYNTRRIVGLLIGGAGNTKDIDVSYATPFYWLWDECIKKQFPDADLYECADGDTDSDSEDV